MECLLSEWKLFQKWRAFFPLLFFTFNKNKLIVSKNVYNNQFKISQNLFFF